jgi:hypothetical protein
MLIAVFKALAKQLVVIASITAVAAALTWLAGGRSAAIELLDIGVARMKGPWVWVFGWGLASFVSARGRMVPLDINGLFEPGEATASVTGRVERATHHRNAWRYTVPITLVGMFLTAVYGIPTQGIGYWIILVMVCSIYYVAAFLLFYFVETTQAFDGLLEASTEVRFRRLYSPLHLENLTSYLAITTTIGVVAIYAGFRGTLTAGFRFHDEVWKSFLCLPLVLFLPGVLFYDYYPRYVLRKILQHRVFKTMERLGTCEDDEARSLVLDLKETVELNSQILPFLDYKSLPSYLLAIFFGISVAYNSDPAVKIFFKQLFRLGSP